MRWTNESQSTYSSTIAQTQKAPLHQHELSKCCVQWHKQKLHWGATTTNHYVVCKPARKSTWSRATFEEQVEQQYKEKNTGESLTLLSVFMEKVAKINLSSDIQCNISKINLSSYIQCNISRQTQKIQNLILKASAMKCIN